VAARSGRSHAQRGRVAWSITFVLTVLALLLTFVVVTRERPRPATPHEPPETDWPGLPPLPLEEAGGAPGVEATPTTPAGTRAAGAEYVVPWRAAAPPTATPWLPAPTPTRRPTPAPRPCVEYSWTWGDSPAVIGQILVEVRIRNRCGRRLEAIEVMFRAEGIRGGDTIYSGQGNLLEPIYPDSVRTVMIALPGARTFYDAVEVAPVNPPVR
jgi:hypothetical protein